MRLFIILFLFASVPASAQTARYTLLPPDCKVTWRGEDLLNNGHEGTLALSSGTLTVTDGKITGGTFKIDMNSLKNTDQRDANGRKDLEEHLKSDDFFSVDKYPFSLLTIVNVVRRSEKENVFTVNAILSIKGIMQNITFPSTISYEGNNIRCIADIVIDRTRWNITYQSKTILQSLKDGAIKDDIKISVRLLMKKY